MGHSEGCPSRRPYALNTSKALTDRGRREERSSHCRAGRLARQHNQLSEVAGCMQTPPGADSAASKSRCGATAPPLPLAPLLASTPVECASVHHQVIISHHDRPLALPQLGPGGVLRQLPHQLPLGPRGVDHRRAVRAAQLAGVAVVQQHEVKGCRGRVVDPPARATSRGSSRGSGAAHVWTRSCASAIRGTTAG